jgi:glycosyltransferase involved in cell wall biosynthesis
MELPSAEQAVCKHKSRAEQLAVFELFKHTRRLSFYLNLARASSSLTDPIGSCITEAQPFPVPVIHVPIGGVFHAFNLPRFHAKSVVGIKVYSPRAYCSSASLSGHFLPGNILLMDHLLPPTLSIVVPCYNEEDVLPTTADQIAAVLHRLIKTRMIGADSHVVWVDDGSSDRTWSIIKQLNCASPLMRGIKLSRNRGHQNALLAGLLSAKGDIVVSIDADLQDDPELIAQMVQANAAGADIVLGVRRCRATDSAFKRFTAELYYRCLRWMRIEIVHNHADYRLLSRRAIEALRQYGESNLFLRALVMQLGFKSAVVSYDRAPRVAGESKYDLRKMIALALEGVTAFSTMPLRFITVLGFIVSSASFLLAIWALFVAFLAPDVVPGWASTVIPIYMVCGVQLVCLGIMGEYIGKIYHETKRRPRYTIETILQESHSNAGSMQLAADHQQSPDDTDIKLRRDDPRCLATGDNRTRA